MAFRDALLQLSSYPDPTPVSAMEQAVGFAEALGVRLSALIFKIEIPTPSNRLANVLLDIPGMVAAERRKVIANANDMVSLFEDLAAARGIAHRQIIDTCAGPQFAAMVTEYARIHDVTMVPVGEQSALQQTVAECVIFGSGRPTIVFPEVARINRPGAFDNVGVAWDFSRPAARAVADALPILQRAKTVRVVTIANEKTIDTRRSSAELASHLACHDIDVVLEERDAAGGTIGQALENYAAARDLDLLVMGAYGHSRARDFILGGATKTIVAKPPLPVFLSH